MRERSPGRPAFPDGPRERVNVMLPADVREYLRKSGNASAAVTQLVRAAMKRKRPKREAVIV